jgi:hypothetical protein
VAETIGSLVDKICIAELKIYHLQEQVDRKDAPAEHREQCRQRAGIMSRQRDDLAAELNELIERWTRGRWVPKVYRQFKMYNDPKYKIKPTAVHAG